jgi:hypothetical protein
MTPDQARTAIEALGDAFAVADVDHVVAMFAPEGDVVYAGSETGEVAVGRSALTTLLSDLFTRDERYSWRCTDVHVAACSAGYVVVADATLFVDPLPDTGSEDQAVEPARESLPYRVSGLLEHHRTSWYWRFFHGSEPAEVF